MPQMIDVIWGLEMSHFSDGQTKVRVVKYKVNYAALRALLCGM